MNPGTDRLLLRGVLALLALGLTCAAQYDADEPMAPELVAALAAQRADGDAAALHAAQLVDMESSGLMRACR